MTATRHRGPLLLVTGVVSGRSLAILGMAREPVLAITAAFLVGASQTMFMSVTLALVQEWAKDEYRGRVTSVYNLLSGGPMALMGWGDGGLADVYPPAVVLILSGLAFLVVMGLMALRSAEVRRMFATADPRLAP